MRNWRPRLWATSKIQRPESCPLDNEALGQKGPNECSKYSITAHRHRKMSANTRSLIIKGLVLGEVVFLLGSYRVWHKMNTNQEYRFWMHNNYPSVLSGFYSSGEVLGVTGAREIDFKTWGIEE